MKHRTLLSTLLVIAATVGLALVSVSSTASSHNKIRAGMDLTLVADSNVVVDGELVSYVGTFDFGRGRVYGYAAFSPGPPTPLFDGAAAFTDRFELYDSTDFYTLEDGVLKGFDPPAPILSVYESGFGNFATNDWHGLGVVTDVDADGIRLFRHIDPGDRMTWSGGFSTPTHFEGPVKLFVH